MVYSTDPNFKYDTEEAPQIETLAPERQDLRVWLDRKQRGGKTVTLVKGFAGSDADLGELARLLKTQDEIAMALVKAQVGQTVRVLVEGFGRAEGTLSGRLDNNLTVEFAGD